MNRFNLLMGMCVMSIACATLCGAAEKVPVLPAETVTGVVQDGNAVRVDLPGGRLELVPVSASMVRVEYQAGGKPGRISELVDPKLSALPGFTSVDLEADPIVVTGENYRLEVARDPCRVSLFDGTGKALLEGSAVSPMALRGQAIQGMYYGFHNTAGRRKRALPFAGKRGISPGSQGHACSPFLWTTKGFGVFVDADRGSMSWEPRRRELAIDRSHSINPNMLLFLMAGSPREIMADFYRASGRFDMPPRWAMGFMNSQYGMSESEMRRFVDTYRAKRIPLDVVILDIDWFQNTELLGQYRWSRKFRGGPSGKLKRDMDALGIKMVAIRKPFIKGHLKGPIMPLAEPDVRKAMWDNYLADENNPFKTGIVGYWNDQADEGGRGVPLFHFQFLHMQKAQYEGHRSITDKRVWSINRNFFAGSQRYAYGMWSGDIRGRGGQEAEMLASVNLGAAWWSMDIGSYHNQPLPEGYFRWMQFGAFVPIYRVHGKGGMKRQPWKYGPDAERISKSFIELRYRLVPYLYSAFRRLHSEGLPPVRPLVMDYPDDPKVAELVKCWMFGDAMLPVAVSAEAATHAESYLPAGQWYDFWNNRVHDGGRKITREVTPEIIPLYVKAGAIVPMGPVMQYIGEKPCDPIELRVYPGADARFVLYEDDGATYAYEKGAYTEIPISWDERTQTLTVGARKGAYPEMPASRTFHVTVARPGRHAGIAADPTPDAILTYEGKPVSYAHDSFRIAPAGEVLLQANEQHHGAQATVTVTSRAGRKLPALQARSSAAWLAVKVRPGADERVLQLAVQGAKLASGIHTARVELAGEGYADTALDVRFRLNGAPRPATLSLKPSRPVLTKNGKVQFTAEAVDQFGQPFEGKLNWTTSGGGSISPAGEFQSNGRPGEFTIGVKADGHEQRSATATVRVGDWIPGLAFTNYLGRIGSVAEIAGLKPHQTGTQKTFHIPAFPRKNEIAFRIHGLLDVPETGEYVLHLSTHDGSRLSLDGEVVIENDGVDRQTRDKRLTLTAGLHPVTLLYFKVDHPKVGPHNAVSLHWTPPRHLKRASLKKEPIPHRLLWHTPAATSEGGRARSPTTGLRTDNPTARQRGSAMEGI